MTADKPEAGEVPDPRGHECPACGAPVGRYCWPMDGELTNGYHPGRWKLCQPPAPAPRPVEQRIANDDSRAMDNRCVECGDVAAWLVPRQVCEKCAAKPRPVERCSCEEAQLLLDQQVALSRRVDELRAALEEILAVATDASPTAYRRRTVATIARRALALGREETT